MPRWVPPVHSPLGPRALWRGAATALFRGAHRRAQQEIDQWVRETYAPTSWAWLDSGTSALRMALELAVSARPTRRIALPAYGCYDLATACDGAGVEAVLYDIDPHSLGPDWSSLQRVLESGVAAVVLVHLYGVPVDLARATAMAKAHDVVVIEDAAQAIGGTYCQKPLGATGHLAILSFGRGKGLTAGGGGLLLVHDARWQAGVTGGGPGSSRGAAAWAKSAVQATLSSPGRYWIPAGLPMLGIGETLYHPAHAVRGLSWVGAGLLAENIHGIRAAAAGRQAVAARWRSCVPEDWQIRCAGGPDLAGWLRWPILLPTAPMADRLALRGQRLGIARGYPRSLADLQGFTPEGAGAGAMPGAELLARQLLTLPTHVYVSQRDMDDVAGLVSALSAPCAEQ